MTTPGYFKFVGDVENFIATKENKGVPLERTITLKKGDYIKGVWINDEGSFADFYLYNGWTLECVTKALFNNVVAYRPRKTVN